MTSRWRAAPRTDHVETDAEHVWKPKFLAEIMAGRDPHVAPNVLKPAVGLTVAGFLDLYFTNYVEAEGLSDPVTVNSRLKAIKKVLGDLPVGVLEKPADILRFNRLSVSCQRTFEEWRARLDSNQRPPA